MHRLRVCCLLASVISAGSAAEVVAAVPAAEREEAVAGGDPRAAFIAIGTGNMPSLPPIPASDEEGPREAGLWLVEALERALDTAAADGWRGTDAALAACTAVVEAGELRCLDRVRRRARGPDSLRARLADLRAQVAADPEAAGLVERVTAALWTSPPLRRVPPRLPARLNPPRVR